MNTSQAEPELRTDAEVHHLRETVRALRDALEEERRARDAEVQAARQAAHDETQQLRQTIQALRDELESISGTHQQKMQAIARGHRDETRQLHETIQALRERLEETGDG